MKIDSFSSQDKAKDEGYTQVEIEAEIRRRAYLFYERRGRVDGHAVDDWLRAEEEILAPKQRSAA